MPSTSVGSTLSRPVLRAPSTSMPLSTRRVPSPCGRCSTAARESSATRAACGLWRWPPRSPLSKESPRGGSQARPSGRRFRAFWEFDGCGPSDGSPHPIPSTKEKKVSFASDRLMEVAEANPETWAVGFEDECWWSRLALPTLNSWSEEGKPLHLLQRSVAKNETPSRRPSPATDSTCHRSATLG
jgi:hypothetical protein